MRRIPLFLMAVLLCTAIVPQALAATAGEISPMDSQPGPNVTVHYDYFLDGRPGTLPLNLSTKLYGDYLGKKSRGTYDNASYFQNFLDDPDEKPYVKTLASESRAETRDPDDQARIAISLVQHIPYLWGSPTRYPYEVLYERSGVCQEKSILLAALLRELGFNSSLMYFVRENHMTVGIACPEAYDFQDSGYCLVETTNVVIITDNTSYAISGRVWSNPEIYLTSDGRSLESANIEYYDARTWIMMQLKSKAAREDGTTLSLVDNQSWYRLQAKYDLN